MCFSCHIPIKNVIQMDNLLNECNSEIHSSSNELRNQTRNTMPLVLKWAHVIRPKASKVQCTRVEECWWIDSKFLKTFDFRIVNIEHWATEYAQHFAANNMKCTECIRIVHIIHMLCKLVCLCIEVHWKCMYLLFFWVNEKMEIYQVDTRNNWSLIVRKRTCAHPKTKINKRDWHTYEMRLVAVNLETKFR